MELRHPGAASRNTSRLGGPGPLKSISAQMIAPVQPLYLTLVFRTNWLVMRKILSLLLFFGSVSCAVAQHSELRKLESFRGINVAEGIDVYLTKGEKESARVEVGGNTELSNVVTEVSGSYLKIYMRQTRYLRNTNVKVFVTYVNIDRIMASSAANVYSEGVIRTANLEIGVSSAASVELKIEVNELEVNASSAGDVELEGKAKTAYFEASSAGKIDADDVEARAAKVLASSAGAIRLSVTDDLNAQASSGGSIRYRGNPSKSRTNSSSGGSVKKSY